MLTCVAVLVADEDADGAAADAVSQAAETIARAAAQQICRDMDGDGIEECIKKEDANDEDFASSVQVPPQQLARLATLTCAVLSSVLRAQEQALILAAILCPLCLTPPVQSHACYLMSFYTTLVLAAGGFFFLLGCFQAYAPYTNYYVKVSCAILEPCIA